MDKNYTDITILLDKSGSMMNCWDETINSLNSFLQEQKKVDGKLSVSIQAFDTKKKKLLEAQNIRNVNKITNEDCYPGGFTALNDALCDVIDETGSRLRSM